MLSVTLKAFDRTCGPTSGGVSRVWIFDRSDFSFTQGAADADGNLPAYSAIVRRTGATEAGGAVMFPVKFVRNEAEYKYSMSKKGTSVKYEHSLEFLMADLDQFITQWNQKVDAAGACEGIGIIVELNSGKILVLGERYVNDALVSGNWEIAQDGASGTSGKLNDDINGHTAVLKGDYRRGAYEFSGGVGAVEALEDQSS